MPVQLLALNEGPSILLDKPILLLGRDLECDIRLDSRKISRRHCCIAQVGDCLLVRDLGSTNGVRINGVRVVEGQLKGDDELMIGNYRYRVRWDSLGGAVNDLSGAGKNAGPHTVIGRPPNEDDLLEESDEPVALPDPSGAPPAVPVGKAHAPAPPPEEQILDVHSDIAPVTPAPRSAYRPALPEELELSPASDELPPHIGNTNHHKGNATMIPGADPQRKG
jgi:predicted component of type VI protein secretion system